MNGNLRGPLTAMATAVLALAVLGGSALAAPVPLVVTFQVTVDNCVSGTANAPSIDLELRDTSDNHVLDSAAATPVTSRHWNACFSVDVPRFGTRLRATSGLATGAESFTIPNLTVETDRVTDIVRGDAPAGHQVKVRLYDCNHLDFACHHKATRTVNINGAGHYSTDMSSAYNARGFDEARVTYTNSAGNSYEVTRVFPWLAVSPPDALVFGESQSGRKVTFRLLNASGSLVQKHFETPPFADYSFHFSHSTSTGRQVTADFASDAKLVIPSTALSQELVSTHVILHVHCLPSRPVMVDYNPGADVIHHSDSHGSVNVDATLDDPSWDPATMGVDITCQSAAGDVITRRYDAIP